MRLISLVAALALAGCAATPARVPAGLVTEAAWASQVSTKRDPYTKVTTIKGGDIKAGQSTIHLRAALSEGRPDIEPKIAVYASLFYSGDHWHFYDRANTIDGNAWEAQSVRRDVLSCLSQRCRYGELVLVYVPATYLRAKIRDGIDLRISGSGGEETFFIPPYYLSAFLSEVPTAR